RGVEHDVARAGAEDGLEAGEENDEQGEMQDVVEIRLGALQRIDDLADESRRDDSGQGAAGGEAHADQELKPVAAEVVEEGRARRGHSVTSLAFCLRDSRVDFPPIHTIATMTANPTKTGATPQRSAIGPTTTSGTRLKIETSMLRKPKTRPRISSGSSSCRSVIDGTVIRAYERPKTNAVTATTATKIGNAAPSP